MKRQEYLEKCRAFAMGGASLQKAEVFYRGAAYYAKDYLLGFAKDGSATHTAVLMTKSMRGLVYAALSQISHECEVWNEQG